MSSEPELVRRGSRTAWLLCIALVSAMLGLYVSWRAAGLDLYARDWLMRARGPIPPPDDIVIVAIDEPSIQRYGRFPWPRSLLSRAVDAVASAHPKVIAVDVLFSEPTEHSEDNALANSMMRAGNVVSAAELVKAASGEIVWLRPIPSIQRASAGIGHVNVSTEAEGIARELLAREADDNGDAFWAMAIEAIRVADGASMKSVREFAGAIRVGSHSIPVRSQAKSIPVVSADTDNVKMLTAQRMSIDFVGPAGSFAPYTFSVADLLAGQVTAAQLQEKYVLIGATATSLGDRVASPFVHANETGDQQYGSLMSGVEVLANSINTILRSRFYSATPDWVALLTAFIIALLVAVTFSIGYSRHESFKQVLCLTALCALLLSLAYFVFTRWLIVPPVVPALVSFGAAAPLALARRAMIASAGLDERIRDLVRAEVWLWPSSGADEKSHTPAPIWSHFPRGLEWKSRTLGMLNHKLLARAHFFDRAMRSVEDGLIVSGLDGRIVFINRRALEIFEATETALLGSSLLERLHEKGDAAQETLARLIQGRTTIEREIILGTHPIRHYNLSLSSVVDDSRKPGQVIGLLASLSDITKQHELQKMKTDVMALVTHELRTPLTAIQGISEVLPKFDVDPKRRREMHTAIHDEAKRLARMIDDYLDMTTLESGVGPLRLRPVQLPPLLDRAVLLLEPRAAKRGIVVVRRCSDELPLALADPDLLSRAITNLIANAIKYSPRRTEVTVTVRVDAGLVCIDVADRGSGIPKEHLGRIFEKFYRVPYVVDAETPGTGLGLAMVREIMELHRGAVTVSSAPGVGSTFSLRLPPLSATTNGGEHSDDA